MQVFTHSASSLQAPLSSSRQLPLTQVDLAHLSLLSQSLSATQPQTFL